MYTKYILQEAGEVKRWKLPIWLQSFPGSNGRKCVTPSLLKTLYKSKGKTDTCGDPLLHTSTYFRPETQTLKTKTKRWDGSHANTTLQPPSVSIFTLTDIEVVVASISNRPVKGNHSVWFRTRGWRDGGWFPVFSLNKKKRLDLSIIFLALIKDKKRGIWCPSMLWSLTDGRRGRKRRRSAAAAALEEGGRRDDGDQDREGPGVQRDARASSGRGGVTRTAVGLCGHGGGVGGGVHSCHGCAVLGDHLWEEEREQDGGVKRSFSCQILPILLFKLMKGLKL